MNSIGKILVVFVTACSLSFLAIIVALRNGGPDWQGEMRSADLQKEFVFTTEPGEKITYSSKHRRTDADVASKTPIMAEVVLKSRKRLEDDTNKKLQELSPQVQPLIDRLALIKKLIPEDDAGVQARIKKYEEQVEKLVSQLKEVGNEFSVATLQTQDVMRLAQDRREENRLRLERRQKQLKQQLGDKYESTTSR
jgi:hypothetical protein